MSKPGKGSGSGKKVYGGKTPINKVAPKTTQLGPTGFQKGKTPIPTVMPKDGQ